MGKVGLDPGRRLRFTKRPQPDPPAPVMLPSKVDQIRTAHAQLIRDVVMACGDPARAQALEPTLRAADEQGWAAVVTAIRTIIQGGRDSRLLAGLDDEDRVIVDSILRGLQDPGSLPAPQTQTDAAHAAPSLAAMIAAAGSGDVQALQALAQMAEQMTQVGGDMGRLGGTLRRLINGERDPVALTRAMGPHGEKLVLAILEELGRLNPH